jgi:hypothetical protein
MEQNSLPEQSQVSLEHLSLLKNADPLSSEVIKLGLAIVALFFEKLDKPSSSDNILEKNQGINQEVFCFYFEKLELIMSEIQNAPTMVNSNVVAQKNLRFVKVVLEDINTDLLSTKNAECVAFKSVYEFLAQFIKESEEANGTIELGTEEVFSFSQTTSDIETLKKNLVTLNQIDTFKNPEEKKIENNSKESNENKSAEDSEKEEAFPV